MNINTMTDTCNAVVTDTAKGSSEEALAALLLVTAAEHHQMFRPQMRGAI